MQRSLLEPLPRLRLRDLPWMPRATSTPQGGNRTLPKSVLSGESDPAVQGYQSDLYRTLRPVIPRGYRLTALVISISLLKQPAGKFGKWLLMRVVVHLTILILAFVQASPAHPPTAQPLPLPLESREPMDSPLTNPATSGPATEPRAKEGSGK